MREENNKCRLFNHISTCHNVGAGRGGVCRNKDKIAIGRSLTQCKKVLFIVDTNRWKKKDLCIKFVDKYSKTIGEHVLNVYNVHATEAMRFVGAAFPMLVVTHHKTLTIKRIQCT